MNQINLTKSGCTQRPTIFQSLTYFLYFPNIIVCFLQIGLLSEAVIYYTILGILTPISLYSATRTTLSVPTDKFLKKQLEARQKGNIFDYDSHRLDSYCDLCQAYVGQNTKHCKHCNRCCQDFDHHCKWVNNCVGGLNYRIFMIMVSSMLLLFLITLIVYIRIIYEYNKYYDQLLIENELMNFHYFNEDLELKYILSIIMLVDSFILFTLLLQLLLFHIYIIIKGITTYDFITQRTKQKINPQLTFSFPIPHLPVAQVDVQIQYEFYQVDKKKTVQYSLIDSHEASPKVQNGVSFENQIKLEDTISNHQQIVA